MNCEVIELPVLEVAAHQLSEVLRSILHTIMFHRSLGMVSPLEVESKVFNLSYIECGDEQIQQVLEEKIAEACKKVNEQFSYGGLGGGFSASSSLASSLSNSFSLGNSNASFSVRKSFFSSPSKTVMAKRPLDYSQALWLSFFERKEKQALFGKVEEKTYWEQWRVNVQVVCGNSATAKKEMEESSTGEDDHRRTAQLESKLKDMLSSIAMTACEKTEHIPPVHSPSVAPFPFEISFPNASDSVFGLDMFKRILNSSPPPMLT